MTIYCIIGIVGFLFSVSIYLATLRGILNVASWRYPALNLLATVMISVSLIDQFNLTSALMGITFGSISVYGILRSVV